MELSVQVRVRAITCGSWVCAPAMSRRHTTPLVCEGSAIWRVLRLHPGECHFAIGISPLSPGWFRRRTFPWALRPWLYTPGVLLTRVCCTYTETVHWNRNCAKRLA